MQSYLANLIKPRLVDVTPVTKNNARIVIEPLERGYGHTLGNALRRVLLSSIPGCAVTSVSIQGVDHEYSSIDGVREDVLDILLNLKNLAIKVHEGHETTLHLKRKGPGKVTAADISSSHVAEVVNPDLEIANLTDAAELDITLHVQRGRGYQPVSTRLPHGDNVDVGSLQLDASFSPIKRVSYLSLIHI